jgi:hypothetical protein
MNNVSTLQKNTKTLYTIHLIGCFMVALWLLYGCFMAALWLLYGCFMVALWLLYGCSRPKGIEEI